MKALRCHERNSVPPPITTERRNDGTTERRNDGTTERLIGRTLNRGRKASLFHFAFRWRLGGCMSPQLRCPTARRTAIARRNAVPPQARKAARNPVHRVPSGKGHAPLPAHPLRTSKILLPAPANSPTTRAASPRMPAHSVSAWKIPPTPRTRRVSAGKFSTTPGSLCLQTSAAFLPTATNSLPPAARRLSLISNLRTTPQISPTTPHRPL